MSSLSKPRRQARAKVGSAAALLAKNPDDPELAQVVEERRREYQVVTLEEHIRSVVDQAPPLTASQRDKLAALLRPSYDGPEAA
ncbi:hypothetical protein [Kribbella sp. NPDC004536]|uniref:hypothetical protein n=1 Tax=Kribbella sp. NPDC004536 TaxID=3364106 RepID=UPI0036923333